MSHIDPSFDSENSYPTDSYPEDRPISLSQAIEINFDPYYENVVEPFMSRMADERFENLQAYSN